MPKDFAESEKQIANAEVVIGIFPDLTPEGGNGTLRATHHKKPKR